MLEDEPMRTMPKPGASERHHSSTGGAAAARAVLPLVVLLGGCSQILDPAGPVSAAEKQILLNSVLIMLFIVVPTILATLGFAWWFRADNPRAHRLPDWAFSGKIELVSWSVPVMTILLLGGITWLGSHALDPAKPIESQRPPLQVQVVSLDWKWLFILPEQKIATVNSLAVPVGTPVQFLLTSSSVMNTFFVPRLGSMIYTMNGMVQTLYLQADQLGVFDGLSGHFSGDGFPDMHFTVEAMNPADFETWVTKIRQSPTPLDRAHYTTLEQPGTKIANAAFGQIDPDLFMNIATQAIPPAPGSRGGSMPDTSPHMETH